MAGRTEIDTFEERWVEWERAGAAHERATQRRFIALAPVLAVVVAAGVAFLLP